VAVAAFELAADRLLLPEDAMAYVESAQQIMWPPEPIDASPFWRVD